MLSSLVLVMDDCPGDRQSLARASTHHLGSEERVKNPLPHTFRDAATGVGNSDGDDFIPTAGSDLNLTYFTDVALFVGYVVGGVDHQVGGNLSDINWIAVQRHQFAKIDFHLGRIFISVVADDKGVADDLVDIGWTFNFSFPE